MPELASRDHVRLLAPLVKIALQESELAVTDLDAVAFTQGPGLSGALFVGAAFATSPGNECIHPGHSSTPYGSPFTD